MAANDPGLAPLGANAEDPTKGAVEKKAVDGEKNGTLVEDERPVAPDQFDEKFETSRTEIWAYYSYYIGQHGPE